MVITDLGVMEMRRGELTLTAAHPRVTVEQLQMATGWELKLADKVSVTPTPTREELTALGDFSAVPEAYLCDGIWTPFGGVRPGCTASSTCE